MKAPYKVDMQNFPSGFIRAYEALSPEAKEKWLADRYRALTDGLYLGSEVLGMDFQDIPHRWLFAKMLKKQPGIPLYDLDIVKKKRMILWSRGTFKTSAVIVEIAQLILNYPSIRICFLTGGDMLAKRQLDRVKRVFERPTKKFRELFPEFCGEKLGNMSEFTVPCRKDDMFAEPTMATTTARSVKAGSHFDVIFVDDLVNDQNYRSIKALQKCIQDYKDVCPLLAPDGFIYVTGTRYSFGDLYENIQELIKKEMEEVGTNPWIVTIKSCWVKICKTCGHRDIEHDFDSNLIEHPCALKCKCKQFVDSGGQSVLFPKFRCRDGRTEGHSPEFLNAERIRLGAEFFACFPAGSPVLRADWTETPVEKLKVGDEIVGFSKGLERAVVQHVHVERSKVVRITTNTGRVFCCSPDHKFLREPNGMPRKYGILYLGSEVVSVYKPAPSPSASQQRDLDWLGGILDGESDGTGIAQSLKANPEVHKRIGEVLNRLDIDFNLAAGRGGYSDTPCDIFEMRGGRSLLVRLLRDCNMAKISRFVKSLWSSSGHIAETSGRGGRGHFLERVIRIEDLGEDTVYNIQSSSGNFVCHGCAVKNCQYENNPIASGEQTFTEELLGKQTVWHENQYPTALQAHCFIVGDLSYVGDDHRDLSVLYVVRYFMGQLYVVDCDFGKWDSWSTAQHLFALILKHRPHIIWLERFLGWEAYQTVFDIFARDNNIQKFPVEWHKMTNLEGAKRVRIGAIKGVLSQRRLWIVGLILGYEQLCDQLKKWPKLGRHDDFADCLGLVCEVPSGFQLDKLPKIADGSNQSFIRKLHQVKED